MAKLNLELTSEALSDYDALFAEFVQENTTRTMEEVEHYASRVCHAYAHDTADRNRPEDCVGLIDPRRPHGNEEKIVRDLVKGWRKGWEEIKKRGAKR